MATVLVVDDASDVRLLIRLVLERAGFTIVEAGGGPEALALLSGGAQPDVAVVDVQMPEMDGWRTVSALRQLPAAAEVPIVLCTVKTGLADKHRAWEIGCDGYLVKPFAIDDLVKEVQAVASRSAAERRALRTARLDQAQAANL